MESDVNEAFLLEAVTSQNAAVAGLGKILNECIDHDVADKPDFRCGNTFLEEIFIGIGTWGEKKVGEGIGYDAVDFLRHGAVEAAEASFQMGDFYAELRGNQS